MINQEVNRVKVAATHIYAQHTVHYSVVVPYCTNLIVLCTFRSYRHWQCSTAQHYF